MQRNPRDRFATAAELANALHQVLAQSGGVAYTFRGTGTMVSRAASGPKAVWIGVLAGVAAAVIGIGALAPSGWPAAKPALTAQRLADPPIVAILPEDAPAIASTTPAAEPSPSASTSDAAPRTPPAHVKTQPAAPRVQPKASPSERAEKELGL
jgi:hypothetical protein